MRKNTLRVIRSFNAGKEDRRDESIWTDGVTIFSYGTALFTNVEDRGVWVFNVTKYSNTTTRHQSGIAYEFAANHRANGANPHVLYVSGLARGASHADLLDALRAATRDDGTLANPVVDPIGNRLCPNCLDDTESKGTLDWMPYCSKRCAAAVASRS
jgi:hypothetical protein